MLIRVYKLITAVFTIVVMTSCSKVSSSTLSDANIISYCIGDIDLDGRDELVVINDKGEKENLPTGEPCGKIIEIYRDFSFSEGKPIIGENPDYSFDFSGMKPSKIQLGDINIDGRLDISVVVYKSVKFHKVLAKRPFFYNFEAERLVPLWLGSRLSRPFDDFILTDINEDGISELVSIEELEDNNRVLAVYKWEGFGFNLISQSADSYKELKFDGNGNNIDLIADGAKKEIGDFTWNNK